MDATADTGGLADLAAALTAYLAELDGYRALCLRNERKATVREGAGGVIVRRAYGGGAAVGESLRARVPRLPGWTETAWWPAEKRRWERLLREAKGEGTAGD